ncbi:hypothetical protein L1049_008032 [Liquidambar formosana]|uniref:Uncharacterized protein n=1 Tax=Liquidambar formosana TaxID=63359 RepID=A0AAP0X4A6_LIQFO
MYLHKYLTAPAKVEEEPVKEESKFKPFSGGARRLDGKHVTELAAPVVKEDQLIAADRTSSGSKRPRRLVVGSNDPKKSTKLSKKDVKGETLKKEEQKFQPFTGKKYTLMG